MTTDFQLTVDCARPGCSGQASGVPVHPLLREPQAAVPAHRRRRVPDPQDRDDLLVHAGHPTRVLTTLAVENYRSLRHLVLPLGRLTVVTGANGSGKSNLYRALRLLAGSARNGAVAALAREGGLPSTLWAGPEVVGRAVRDGTHPLQGTVRREPVALRLGVAGEDLSYAVDLGLPAPSPSAFTWLGRVSSSRYLATS